MSDKCTAVCFFTEKSWHRQVRAVREERSGQGIWGGFLEEVTFQWVLQNKKEEGSRLHEYLVRAQVREHRV